MKVGRNDPCPCGSGKKYKKCCLGNPNLHESPGHADPSALEFSSLDELNRHMHRFTHQQNAAPIKDFGGLSSDQMQQLLTRPFEELSWFVTFNPNLGLDDVMECPILGTLESFLAALADTHGKCRTTPAGNLPRKVVERCLPHCAPWWRPGQPVPKQGALPILSRTVELCFDLKLIDQRGSEIFLTPEGIQLYQQGDWVECFQLLVTRYIDDYDWQFNLPENWQNDHFDHIASSAPFSLWVLAQHETGSITHFLETYHRAFPAFIAPARKSAESKGFVESIFVDLLFDYFCQSFGFLERSVENPDQYTMTGLFQKTFVWKCTFRG